MFLYGHFFLVRLSLVVACLRVSNSVYMLSFAVTLGPPDEYDIHVHLVLNIIE